MRIINNSGGFEADADIHWTDRAFDYWTRYQLLTVLKSAGNTGDHLTSPGKAWNLITVGGFEDNNDANWFNDRMWASSAYINPVSPHSDREKPEVVAVSVDVTILSNNNAIVTRDGTSYAAPQVAGLTALLVHRDPLLRFWPEAIKAIIMASATHNIAGPTTIVSGQGDLHDGAGAINAALADTIVQSRGDTIGPCYVSCWWGESLSNSNFPVGTELERNFYANRGDLIRVVIVWWANADAPSNDYSFDRLDTDLDLRVKYPDGQYVSGVNSLSFDNNYEMVEFIAPQTAVYKIAIRKVRADESSNSIGIAFVRLHRVYIPVVLKNFP